MNANAAVCHGFAVALLDVAQGEVHDSVVGLALQQPAKEILVIGARCARR